MSKKHWEKNPQADQFVLPQGYRDLGYQFSNVEEKKVCQDAGHKVEEFDNSLYLHRGTDFVYTCPICKIAWHIDMSD